MKYLFIVLIFVFTISGVKAQDFTIGFLPDIQNMSKSDTEALKIQKEMQYYIDNKSSLNLKMVVSLGDNVYGYNSDAVMQAEYGRVKPSFNLLKVASIPYVPCVGNHDGQLNDQGYTFFNSTFPINEMQAQNPYLKGNLNGSANTYYLFSEAGIDFIMVVIESHDQFIVIDKKLDYDLVSITWANDLFKQYSTRRGIFVTHDLFEANGYRLINDVIKKNDNIFMALCGHSCSRAGFNGQITGEYAWTETTNGGKKVQCILSNFQCDADNGATLRYYTFKPSENKILAYTYNVLNKAFKTGPNSQFSFEYEMNGGPIVTSFENASSETSLVPEMQFSVYPNPTNTNFVNIEFVDGRHFNASEMLIFDLQGQLLLRKRVQQNDKLVVANIESLIAGVYLVKVADNFQKLIVK